MLLKIFHFKKTVATAGTSEQLTTSNLHVPSVIFQAETNNTGKVYIGNDQVSVTNAAIELSAGDSVEMSAASYGDATAKWDLSDFHLDVSVSTDGVFVGYAERKDT